MKSKFFTIATLVIAAASAGVSVSASAANLDNYLFDQMATGHNVTHSTARADASVTPKGAQPTTRSDVSRPVAAASAGSNFYGATGQMQIDAPVIQAPRPAVFARLFSRNAVVSK